ncbi:unnamed protein product [Pedinophyceae sp. YPF-701]|nr:unnamed protein product [Pedinophyceae sp. YPF-701]
MGKVTATPCKNCIYLKHPAEKVWALLKDFDKLNEAAPNVVQKCELVSGENNTVGARRNLNDAFMETLVAYDADNMTYTYSIDQDSVPPQIKEITNYRSTFTVVPINLGAGAGGCVVTQQSSWEEPEGDKGTHGFCMPIYGALFKDMEALLG